MPKQAPPAVHMPAQDLLPPPLSDLDVVITSASPSESTHDAASNGLRSPIKLDAPHVSVTRHNDNPRRRNHPNISIKPATPCKGQDCHISSIGFPTALMESSNLKDYVDDPFNTPAHSTQPEGDQPSGPGPTRRRRTSSRSNSLQTSSPVRRSARLAEQEIIRKLTSSKAHTPHTPHTPRVHAPVPPGMIEFRGLMPHMWACGSPSPVWVS